MGTKINKASFLQSSAEWKQCPPADKVEVAFIGRSNVGKSSLINTLTHQKNLAKTSGTPGKTQLINHFLINEDWYLVDLPGYGYAKVSKTQRKVFQEMIHNYLTKRDNLACVFLLIDIRLSPQPIDLEFITFLGESQIPFAIVFTKADKLKPKELISNTDIYKETLLTEWEKLPPIFITSSSYKEGIEELNTYLGEVVALSKN